MNIHIDDVIFSLQANGGISQIWAHLLIMLKDHARVTVGPVAPDDTDWFLSSYYTLPPNGMKSLVLVYDMIAERYPLIGPSHPDAVRKRAAIKTATAVVAISGQTAADVLAVTGRPVNAVAYPAVQAMFGDNIPAAEVQGFKDQLTGGQPYVLVMGNRGLYKNVQALYQAWPFFPDHDRYKLVCVGGERELPQDIAFDTRYPGTWVHVALNDTDKQIAYCGASMLVYPSLMEGFGIPPVEAYRCHCAVVCGDTMREVMGDAAFYCDVTRPRSIADAMHLASHVMISDRPPLSVDSDYARMAKTLVDTMEAFNVSGG